MINKYRILWLAVLFYGLSCVSAAAQGVVPQVRVNARGAVLAEISTGQVLMEQDPETRIQPASFTKVLTLFLVFEALEQGLVGLQDRVMISQRAWRTGGSKMFIEVDTRVPLEDLIKGIAVVSGNDACVAVAEHLYGSVGAFVTAMNEKAAKLGMDNSHFENPHGLPAEEQYTSAGDMARLACAYVRRFPQALRYHSMQEYTYSEITQHNRNGLLRKDPAVNGLKTGYVSEAGYHLMATAEKEGLQLVAVVMGTESPSVREREALTLLNHGFRHYAYFRPFQEGDTVTTLRVWKGEADSVPLILGESAALIIPRRKKDSVTWKVETVERAVAPISARQRLGEIVIYLSETPKKSVPLVSAEEVPKGGLFKRLWHSLRLVQVLNWRVVGIVAGAVVVFLLAFAVFSRRRSSRSSSTFRTRR